MLVVNKPDLFKGGYERYILNRLHEELPYSEVPIRLIFSERRRMGLSELKGGVHRAGGGDETDIEGFEVADLPAEGDDVI